MQHTAWAYSTLHIHKVYSMVYLNINMEKRVILYCYLSISFSLSLCTLKQLERKLMDEGFVCKTVVKFSPIVLFYKMEWA